MRDFRTASREVHARYARMATFERTAVWCTVVFGLVGCVSGLALGLVAHPPTAWFAVLEVGLPSTCVGAVVGLLAGLARRAVDGHRRGRHHDRRS